MTPVITEPTYGGAKQPLGVATDTETVAELENSCLQKAETL